MFEAHPSIQRRTYEPAMASPPSFGLGGSTNHSLRDLRLAEPNQEVDRLIASQGIEIDRRSFCVLPATPNPHNGTQLLGCGYKVEDSPTLNSSANYKDEAHVRTPNPHNVAQTWGSNSNANSKYRNSSKNIIAPPQSFAVTAWNANDNSNRRPAKFEIH